MSDLERLGESLRAALKQRDEAYLKVHSLKKENAYLKKTILDLRAGHRELSAEIARLQRLVIEVTNQTLKSKPTTTPSKGERRK